MQERLDQEEPDVKAHSHGDEVNPNRHRSVRGKGVGGYGYVVKGLPQNQPTVKTAHENLVLQIIISAVNDNPKYLDSNDCQLWLDTLDINNSDAFKRALVMTDGKVLDKRYIAERMDS
jgi:hypothetical protein